MSNRIKLKGTTEKVFDIGIVNKQTFDASAFTGNHIWVLPDSNGSSGYVLSTDGSGNLSWAVAGSATPAGSNTEIQFNNSGAFGADNGLTYDSSTEELTVGSTSNSGKIQFGATPLFLENFDTGSGNLGIRVSGSTLPLSTNGANVRINAQPGVGAGTVDVVESGNISVLSPSQFFGTINGGNAVLNGGSIIDTTNATNYGGSAIIANGGFSNGTNTFNAGNIIIRGGIMNDGTNNILQPSITVSGGTVASGTPTNGKITLTNAYGLEIEISPDDELTINSDPGTVNQVITSQGPGLPPVWADAGGIELNLVGYTIESDSVTLSGTPETVVSNSVNIINYDLTADTDLTLETLPVTDKSKQYTFIINNAGSFSITFIPADSSAFYWMNGTLPSFTSSGIDIVRVTGYALNGSRTNWFAEIENNYITSTSITPMWVLAYNGDFDYSTDNAVTFITADSGTQTGYNFTSVAYGAGVFVGMWYDSIFRSLDGGQTWVDATTSQPSSSYSWNRAMAYDTPSGNFAALGLEYSGGTANSIFSTDLGDNWNVSTTIADPSGFWYRCVAGPTTLIGLDISGIVGSCYSTDGGDNWITSTTPLDLANPSYDAAYGNGKFIAVAGNGVTYQSTDGGDNWSTYTTISNPQAYVIAYGNSIWVAAGGDGNIFTSTDDGATWTDQGYPGGSGGLALVYGNNQFLLTDGSDGYSTSPDGVTWTYTSNSIYYQDGAYGQ